MRRHGSIVELPVGVKGDANIQALVEHFSSKPGELIFACGGSIPIKTEISNIKSDAPPVETVEESDNGDAEDGQSTTSTDIMVSTIDPITLRWDANDPATAVSKCRLTFPGTESAGNIAQLMADMQPATFGRGGKDVYDEEYRKASKMDTSRFSSDFDPHAMGIIDTIAQMLLPDFVTGQDKRTTSKRAVRAELYKLNVYAGPSGHFRAHVDTPRSASQFGSLVVCLPVEHEGGQLVVRHKGQTTTFDWGKDQSTPAIQWAAFYSDCEHEVLEVKSGHRVTLTYNLYAARGNGMLAGHPSGGLRADNAPSYDNVKKIFSKEDFMPEGGYLGIWASHAYAHTSNNHCLPDALKGTDMVVWETLGSLGCEMHLRPVIDDWDHEHQHEWWLEHNTPTAEEISERAREMPQTIIGHSKALRHENFDGEKEEYEWIREMMDEWRKNASEEEIRADQVVWLTPRPKDKGQIQITYIAYGNEASLGCIYSDCTILAKVPAFSDRVAALTK